MGLLEVSAIVPFHHRIFKLANSAHVAVYLLSIVSSIPSEVLVISKNIESRWNCDTTLNPFNRLNVHQSLQTVEIDCYFNRVFSAYLGNRLDVRPPHYLHKVVTDLILSLLTYLFLLILMNPCNPILSSLDNVTLEVCYKLLFRKLLHILSKNFLVL